MNRTFRIFWAGQTLSALGDAFALIAIPLLVLQATHSVTQMGLVTATSVVGRLLAGLWAGVIVDRVDRRRLMIACDLGRAAIYAAIPLGWWLAGPRIALLYVVTAIGSALGMFFQVAYVAAVANLVDRPDLPAANGRLHVTYSLSMVVGPMLAGSFSNAFGPAGAVGIDAISFALSAASLAFIQFRASAASVLAARAANSWREMLEGARFLWRDPVLRAVSWILIWVGFLTAGCNDLAVFRIKSELGGDDGTVGSFYAIASVGAIVGGALVARLRARLGFGACFLAGTALEGVFIALLGVAPSLFVMAPMAAMFSFGQTVRGVSSMSLRQQITPDRLIGRVTAVFWVVVSGLSPIGAALATRAAASFGTRAVLGAMGVLGLGVTVWGAGTAARQRAPERRAPVESTA